MVAEHPHDPGFFTQGLEIRDGRLYESGGGYGVSRIAVRELRSGKLLSERRLPASFFAEGLTVLADRLLLLTWRERVGFILGPDLEERGRFPLTREGWGLTRLPGPRGEQLLMSDGSARLYRLDPRTFREVGSIPVTEHGRRLDRLNELEYAAGSIYANVWTSDRIAVIAPADGSVLAWLDLRALRERFAKPPGWNAAEHVLNGIAYDPASGHFLVTGKCWPRLFEIEVERPAGPASGTQGH